MAPYDIYERINVLRALLLKQGFVGFAKQLKHTVEYGYTGTEIHMHLRKLLADFLAGHRRLHLETRELVKEILAHIEKVLE